MIDKTKAAQLVIKATISDSIWNISYALGAGRTSATWSVAHWCRAHQLFLVGKHTDECDLIRALSFSSTPPTFYNDFWIEQRHLSAKPEELTQINSFYLEVL